jgi:hypothetical protein
MFGNKFASLYPFRFAAHFAHTIATVFIYGAAPFLARSGMPFTSTAEEIAQREEYVVTFASMSLALQSVDAALLVFGTSLSSPASTLFHGVAHSLGAFFTLWAVCDAWSWQSIPWIFSLFTLPSFCLELCFWRPVGPALQYLRCWGRIISSGFRRSQRCASGFFHSTS